MSLNSQNKNWLFNFCKKNSRAPRILHIGNIANNAYINSKILRAAGFNSDVICYEYKHIMGSPEWEECDIKKSWGDDFNPNWKKAGVSGFKRPKWFYSGKLEKCILQIELTYSKQGSALRIVIEYFLNSMYRLSKKAYFKVLQILSSRKKYSKFFLRIFDRWFTNKKSLLLKKKRKTMVLYQGILVVCVLIYGDKIDQCKLII